MSVKKFGFIFKTAKIFRRNLPTHVKEHQVSLFWLPLCNMPSTSRLALCIWHIQKTRVKYRVRRISCDLHDKISSQTVLDINASQVTSQKSSESDHLCVFVPKHFFLGFFLFFVQLWNVPALPLLEVRKVKLLYMDIQLFWLKNCLWENMFFLIRKLGY